MRSNSQDTRADELLLQSGRLGSRYDAPLSTVTLLEKDSILQLLDPGGGAINVHLPVFAKGRWFIVANVGVAGSLVVKTAGGGSTLATLSTDEMCLLVSGPSSWEVLQGGTGGLAAADVPQALYDNLTVVEKTDAGNYTMLTADDIILVNKAVGGATQIDLVTASGRVRPVKVVDLKGDAATNVITIEGNAAETVIGAANYLINFDRGSVTLWPYPDGSGWYI